MFGYPVELPVPLGPQVAMFAALGALSTVLANRGVSVWHDGLRPIIPSMLSGALSKREVSRTSFALALGFLWAFGLPFSLGYVIPLVYLIFIATDWFGVSLPADFDQPWYRSSTSIKGVLASLGVGAAWGAAVSVGLWAAAEAMDSFPIPMASGVQLITAPALGAFFLFMVLTIAYHYGLKMGLIAGLVTTLAWGSANALDLESPPAWSFGAGAVMLLVLLVRESRANAGGGDGIPAEWAMDDDDDAEADDEAALFDESLARIKRNLVLLAVLHGLAGAAYNWGFMAIDPISAALYAKGMVIPAVLVVLAWAFAFIPMKFTTAAVTGCMCMGTMLEPAVGMLMPNPWSAFIAVALLRVVEVYSLLWVVRNVERFPGIREVADIMRTAIFHVMEIAFLVGGTVAAISFAGEWGAAVVVAAWFFNTRANSPVMPMSLGAVAAIGVGLVANGMYVLGLPL